MSCGAWLITYQEKQTWELQHLSWRETFVLRAICRMCPRYSSPISSSVLLVPPIPAPEQPHLRPFLSAWWDIQKLNNAAWVSEMVDSQLDFNWLSDDTVFNQNRIPNESYVSLIIFKANCEDTSLWEVYMMPCLPCPFARPPHSSVGVLASESASYQNHTSNDIQFAARGYC